MYRKARQEQESNQSKMENSVQNVIQQSQFFTRLLKLPVVTSAVAVASDFYGKAKNSGGIVGKTIGLAESTSYAVAEQVFPLAQKFSPLAVPLLPLQKVDALANFGLEQLETRAPIITRQPQDIVTETKELVSATVNPAVQRFNSVSTVILGSPVAQFGFDVAENILDTVSSVVDRLLPSGKASEKNGSAQNGYIHEASPADKSARTGYLFRKAYYLGSSVLKRILGVAQNRVESVVSVGDTVVNTARKSLNNMLTPNADKAPAPVQNGDSKPRNKSKKSQ
jgi:hypothetical protein